jgi:deoxycytidylate deaminase/dephospho-CoA kinase
MQTDLVRGIEYAYAERANPIVFALTGRTGSGCTTAAASLASRYGEIALSEEDFSQPERRKMSIALDYARANWVPFTAITVSSVIFSFLLDHDPGEVDSFLAAKGIAQKGRDELNEHLGNLAKDPSYYAFKKAMRQDSSAVDKALAWQFFETKTSPLALQTRKVLAAQYPALFQTFGDNVRFSGNPLDSTVRPEKLFALMDRVRHLIECVAAYRGATGENRVRVVIDAIRNPLELVYLRKHIANLFVIAITADDKERRSRLLEGVLGKKEIDAIDAKEYDGEKHLTNYTSFVSQNLKDCIQKADVFVANPGAPGQLASSVRFMNAQLVRYVALALRPGLVTPTRDERCMQIAFVAKLNSGCISRQVGAVVADGDYSIHSLGWNDTPKGQTTCLLRDVGALLSGSDSDSFSDYEKTDAKLRSFLEKKFKGREYLKHAQGLRCPYCFKDAYNHVEGRDNQVHTRSLHAEENAFLQLAKRGGSGISGGVLYTTASPCELCSKKAYQLGITEVVYVDPYPGISMTHVLKSGPESTRPKLRLFSGAVGHAYHRLYEAILPIKDEYGARLEAADQVEVEKEGTRQEERNLSLWN